MEILIIFTALSLANVIFSTVRSITTIKCGKLIASLISAGYFSFYNIMIIWTVADFPLWEKCAITFCCNLLGVFIVKLVEEKMKKDKLWIYQVTAKETNENMQTLMNCFKEMGIKIVYNEIIKDKLYSMQVFSYNQKESKMIETMLENYDVKYATIETNQTGRKDKV